MLGDLSKRYESNDDPGCISTGYGDAGGKSYGTYQLASNAGSVSRYIEWLQANGYWFGGMLAKLSVGSKDFDTSWKGLAESDNREDFAKSQHEYIKAVYFEPACAVLERNYYHVKLHHEVMQDVIWSRAVQYGVGNILDMFTEAVQSLGYPNLSYVDHCRFDKDMIKAIYLDVCSTREWTNGSPALRENLYKRYKSECADALARI